MLFDRKGGICLKRRLAVLLLCCLLFTVIVLPASAESSATKVQTYVTVTPEGDCLVSMTATLHLESAEDSLTFPLPANAKDITMNGQSARTTKGDSAILVDLSRATGGLIGDFTVAFSFTIPDAVKLYVSEETDKEMVENGKPLLILTVPLLNGFSHPVQSLEFIVTLPGDIAYYPNFTSTYRQTSIGSDLEYDIDKKMLSGHSIVPLNDHDSVTMTMVVTQEMFPTVSTYRRVGNPEVVPMLICAGLALLYWLIFLRTLPLIRRRSVTPPEGLSAGEIGCHLTLAGGDLTMMVMNWAQLGYILIQLDGHGRVLLHKRMDMGNERSLFEVRIFKTLFGTRRVVDATGIPYAKLSRKVFAMIPGERSLRKEGPGSMKVFRALCCGSQVFCGICVAMNMTSILILQVMFSLILGAFGAISAWQIQEIAYRTHLRGKTRVYIGLVCILIWIILGILCGQWIIPLCAVLGQMLASYFAAYGGRRSDIGRHDAGQILGLRHYLKRIPKEEIQRLTKTDPDYFFNMAPYALSLGIIHPFASNFGSKKLEQCPYLMTRVHGKRTAAEWAELMAQAADMMDARYRRMEIEKWTAVQVRTVSRPRR